MRSAPQVGVTAALRDEWIASTDAQLLAQSQTDRYRASGPGGQHRNKTESAVRVRHTPSGVTAMSEDSRSQGENRDRALRRLREKFALELRAPIALDGFVPSPTLSQLVLGGTARLGAKTRLTSDYLQGMAQLLDVFVATGNEVAATAALLGLTTGATSKLLTHDDNVAKVVNQHRVNAGLRPLR